jgi:hypothetical protein
VRKARKDKQGNILKDKDGKSGSAPVSCSATNVSCAKGRLQYDLEVHVSGYCATITSAENAGLILKAALKIMRGKPTQRIRSGKH